MTALIIILALIPASYLALAVAGWLWRTWVFYRREH